MDNSEKVKRLGNAVVQLELELIDEGKPEEASKLVGAFAALPVASMARLYDILTKDRD